MGYTPKHKTKGKGLKKFSKAVKPGFKKAQNRYRRSK